MDADRSRPADSLPAGAGEPADRGRLDSSAGIVVDGVTVIRGGNRILDGLSCRMAAGSITGLLGPSGAGKTTLIRAIVGVQKIRSGSITVLGSPAGHPRLRATTGYVTQSPSVYPDLSVRENLAYFASIMAAPRQAVDAALTEVGLERFAHQSVGSLSGGQRSRASLACALVGQPALLVLDEPTVGQDPELREDLWKTFRARAHAGTTVLVSSHVMDEASRCDRLLLIRDGRLLADDTPAGVLASAGTADMDEAFLTLIRRSATPVSAGGLR